MWKIKLARFFINFLVYAGFLASSAWYIYIEPKELFAVKEAILPFNAAVVLALIFSLILSGLNEIVSMFIIKRFAKNLPQKK